MTTKTQTYSPEHMQLVKKYHTLCTKAGKGRKYKEMVKDSFGVDSSLDIADPDLEALCDSLEKELNPELKKLDTWRKRVMGSIGGWLKLIGRESNASKIKAIACRASGYDNFNDIPRERLSNLSHAFNNKQKDFKMAKHVADDELKLLSRLN